MDPSWSLQGFENESIQNCWQGSGGLTPASVGWWCNSILSSYTICFPTLGKWKCEDEKAFRWSGGSSRSVLTLKQLLEEKTPAAAEPGSRRIQASTPCLGPSPLPESWLCRLVRGSVAER